MIATYYLDIRYFYSALLMVVVQLFSTEAVAQSGQSGWLKVEIGIIGTASDEILTAAMDRVRRDRRAGLILVLDTPGGSLESTRTMVKSIMSAEFPVIVWVGPGGGRAASAGAFITLAAHIAAMAPSTNIGAAHPIDASGKDIQGEAARKVENDTIAFMESIAAARKRNPEMAVSFVKSSVSITAEEAKQHQVIDLIAKDLPALLQAIDQQEVELTGGQKVRLETADVVIDVYQPTLRQNFLSILSNPNLFYLLFLAGLIGIGFELTHPGALFPGVAGGISLILALIATTVLPVSFGALMLVVAGVAFMIGEIFLPSFGVLGIGGFIAFLAGSVLLVDPSNEHGLRISWYTIAPGAITIAASILTIGYLVLKLQRSKVAMGSGAQAMVGELGTVLVDFAGGKGRIRVAGEDWQAESKSDDPNLKRGAEVTVTAVEGLKLIVKSKA